MAHLSPLLRQLELDAAPLVSVGFSRDELYLGHSVEGSSPAPFIAILILPLAFQKDFLLALKNEE